MYKHEQNKLELLVIRLNYESNMITSENPNVWNVCRSAGIRHKVLQDALS